MKKALILGTWHNAPYHPFQEVDALLADLLREDFEVTLTDRLSDLQALRTGKSTHTDHLLDASPKAEEEATMNQLSAQPFPKSREYSLLVSYLDAFDETLPPEAAEAVAEFVQNGGGLLCLHNGISLQTDDRMFRLIGGKFLRHPPQTVLNFQPTPAGILSDLPGFSFPEEPYQFEFSGDAITPLLQYQYDGFTFPGGWSREEGRGRVAFLTPGHSMATFRQKEYQEMILRCAKWCVRGQ